ncbi:restriction endonuclease subunit S [Peptoniphilus sp.]|jgi:type I restriction enzyme S subunit|uniref:restriction endonuclease subunit S n=1 Tax=Peptoniphilus sp. TaxID=1971214 RepID=UPI003D8E3CD3
MEWIELGKLGEVSTGNTPKKKNLEFYSSEYIPFIKPTSFKINKIVELDVGEEWLSKLGSEQGRIANKNDILVTCIGSVGNIGIAKDNICFNQQINAIKVNEEIINHKYLAYALFFIRPTLMHIANNAVVPIINKSNFEKIKIPVPSLKIQEDIVEILDNAQSLIDKRREQIELLDDLIESVFYEMFGDPFINNKNWGVKALKEVVEINPPKSELKYSKDFEIEVSFVPMEDVKETGNLILNETKKISEVYKSYTYFKEDDILFAKITPCMENGKSCIAKNLENKIGFGSTEFHVIRVGDFLNNNYLLCLIRTDHFKKLAESKMTGSAGQRRVPANFLKNFEIPVPPIELQNKFADIVNAIESEKEIIKNSLNLLEENYKSIMDSAFKEELFH